MFTLWILLIRINSLHRNLKNFFEIIGVVFLTKNKFILNNSIHKLNLAQITDAYYLRCIL